MTTLDPSNTGPESFPLVVILKRTPARSRWQPYTWTVSSVLVHSGTDQSSVHGVQMRSGADGDEFLWSGLTVTLYRDEAESYYHNIMAEQPALYVVTRNNNQGEPEPFTVTASFDEAHAYMEGEENAHSVALPAELYAWIERFVLTHYVPEKRKKRKRQNWKENHHREHT